MSSIETNPLGYAEETFDQRIVSAAANGAHGPADDLPRVQSRKSVHLVGQAKNRDREIDDLDNALATAVIDHVGHPILTTVGKPIADEIDRSAFIVRRRHRHRDLQPGQRLALLVPQLRAFLSVQPVGPLALHLGISSPSRE